ncbi:Rha family transcriptional regulator [Pollutimonas subterranea]|uniref:Rha family transcriptional regulator n=1 Tax=Pollutimonas subterranea TaxID=2045210 RepID=UPI0013041EA1|nr:Rha family transcriptional regulator [Pollutimonas subterranea]
MRELLANYVVDFRELGVLQFQTGEITGRGQPEKYALLNEDQAYLLLTFSRNTARVRKLKVGLVKAFREARQVMGVHQDEYLPTYRSLHDEISRLAGESRNARFVHMNINKAINQTLGVKSGQRHGLPLPCKAMLIVAQIVARNAMTTSLDHKDAYQSVKRALQALHQALVVARYA